MIQTSKSTWFLIAVFGVVLSNLRMGNALSCYECNSYKDGDGCVNPESLKNFSRPCDKKPNDDTFVACRKITQTIDFQVNGLPPDSRVIRSCAYVRQEINKCYQRSGFGGRQEVCACGKDNCNIAAAIKSNLGLFLTSSLFLAYSSKHLVHL